MKKVVPKKEVKEVQPKSMNEVFKREEEQNRKLYEAPMENSYRKE